MHRREYFERQARQQQNGVYGQLYAAYHTSAANTTRLSLLRRVPKTQEANEATSLTPSLDGGGLSAMHTILMRGHK